MDKEELNRAWIEVDLDAIRRNAERLSRRAGSPIIAMLKSDAYGLGAVAVARALRGRPGIWGFGVATVAEGEALRSAGIGGRLFCPTPVLHAEYEAMRSAHITPSLSSAADIEAWCAKDSASETEPWHLAVDTGMHRAGVAWNAIGSMRDVLAHHPPEGMFTHFFASDLHERSRAMQEARFAKAVLESGLLRSRTLLHVDNSLGVASRAPEHEPPRYDLARPGIGLYGWPEGDDLGLEEAVRLFARVVELRTVNAGESVSYGASWTAPAPRRVATISIGYADGYRRHFSNSGQVVINGTRCPVVGIVTMDMIMADVTDAKCETGDIATLISRADGLSVDTVAEAGGLSPYELLVGLRLRLARVHAGGFDGSLEQDL